MLDQVVRLQIPKLPEKRPDVFGVIQLSYSYSACHGSRLDQPGCRHAVKKRGEVAVVKDRRELRYRDAASVRFYSHRQLVTEVPNLTFSDAGHSKVLPQERSGFDIEVVQRH